jgi:hypothetical protein
MTTRGGYSAIERQYSVNQPDMRIGLRKVAERFAVRGIDLLGGETGGAEGRDISLEQFARTGDRPWAPQLHCNNLLDAVDRLLERFPEFVRRLRFISSAQ